MLGNDQLGAEAVEVAHHPGAGEPAVGRAKEGGDRVLERPAGGSDPEQHSSMVTAALHANRGSIAFTELLS
jgi:hypothetical protein